MADKKSEGAESASAHPDKLTIKKAVGYGAALVVGGAVIVVLSVFLGVGLDGEFGCATKEREPSRRRRVAFASPGTRLAATN
jgi:hypothetical protein